jgi:hypothetical protein
LLLFDIIADPVEAHDLAADKPDLVVRMNDDLQAWRAGCRESAAGADER